MTTHSPLGVSDKPGLHVERLQRVWRIIRTARDVDLSDREVKRAKDALTSAEVELLRIIEEMKNERT